MNFRKRGRGVKRFWEYVLKEGVFLLAFVRRGGGSFRLAFIRSGFFEFSMGGRRGWKFV